jgi:hypothetical protein
LATSRQVDVLDPQTDEFGPAQADVDEKRHDVALVAAGGRERLDFLGDDKAMTFPFADAAG